MNAMNSQFMLSQGAGQKLEFAVQRNDGTTLDIDYLSSGENFRAVTLLRTGKARIVEVCENGSEGAVIPTVPTPTAWTVNDQGNIHFMVTSNGFTRERWKQHLESRGSRFTDWVRTLCRESEAPTNGVAYHIVIRLGSKIASHNRITKEIRAYAADKGWKTPHWEVAYLIRDLFTDQQLEQMGLWYIITMHEPIKDAVNVPYLLGPNRHNDGSWLDARNGQPDYVWCNNGGFAFEVPYIG
jgi:hypothetical protein